VIAVATGNAMPTLNLFTNIPVDPVITSDILRDATKAVAKIIGKPESVKPIYHPLPFSTFIYYSPPTV
jgi:hypothetical protein